MADLDTQTRPIHRQEIHLKCKGRLEENEWEIIYHATINQKKVGVAILVSDKADFRERKWPGTEWKIT